MSAQHSISSAIEQGAEQRMLAKQLLEARLFASPHALTAEELASSMSPLGQVATSLILTLLDELRDDLSGRQSAIELAEIAGGYVLQTRPHLAAYLAPTAPKTQRLSSAQLEVLAIVASRQPTTRAQIEAIRGVDCSHPLSALMEKGLVENTGRSPKPGRPALYATTRQFLEHFGLQSVSELQGVLEGATPTQ